MIAAPRNLREPARLRSVEEYDLSADVAQADLEPLIRLASALFDLPMAMVSVVEQHRTLFTARIGLEVCELDRDVSFCSHVLDRDDPLVVLDARLDPRFSGNPLVTGTAQIRFYAGAPLKGPNGHVIGSFCLVDTRPRNAFDDESLANLNLLAELALDKLELRRLTRAQRAGQNRFRNIAATSPAAIICTDANGTIQFWNGGAEAIFGYSAAEAEGRTIDLIVPVRMKGAHLGGMHKVASGGTPTLIGKSVEVPAIRKDGQEVSVELALSMWDDDGQVSFGAVVRDLTARRANEERLYRLAHFDHLTGLPNRIVMRQRLDDLVATGTPAAFLMLDLDGFKHVNDVLGHSGGDELLREVAVRLLDCLDPTDTVARIGGDEFAVIVPAASGYMEADEVAGKLLACLSRPYLLEGQAFEVGASIGLSLFPLHGSQAMDLMTGADLALYQAKAEGRHCRRFYTAGLRRDAVLKRTLETELQRAHDRGEFELFYQPQVDPRGAVVGAEALIRWRHPERGLQSPAAFLPALEGSPLAARLGTWIIDTACAQAAEWRRHSPSFRMGVNLFGIQFRSGTLVDVVRAALARSGLPPKALELEITENIILKHDDVVLAPLQQLREDGVGVAFDDFGTGFASLSMLKRYPITRLKIDQSFVRNLCDSVQDASIIRAVVHMAKAFGLEVIAEGVETEEQMRRLLHKGCDELQGFMFGRPMPAGEFGALIEQAGASLGAERIGPRPTAA